MGRFLTRGRFLVQPQTYTYEATAMRRNFGDWEAWTAVEHDGGPVYRTAIWVKHAGRGIIRPHYFEGFRLTQAVEAGDFIERQFESVTGVSDDGTLRIR